MKKSLFFALFAALPVMAQDAAPEQCPAQQPCCKAMPCAPAKPCCGKHGQRPDFRKMMLEKFDANKDGQLDDAEKAAAKAEFEAKRAEMKAAFEKKMLEKFDANKDGQLDDAEKAAAKAEFEKMRAERGGKRGPRCGRHGHRGPKRPCCGGPRGHRHMNPEKMAECRAKFMEKFDANKDGQLDDAEKAAAKAEFEAKRAERGGKCGKRGPKRPCGCPSCGSKPEKQCEAPAPAEQPAA